MKNVLFSEEGDEDKTTALLLLVNCFDTNVMWMTLKW